MFKDDAKLGQKLYRRGVRCYSCRNSSKREEAGEKVFDGICFTINNGFF